MMKTDEMNLDDRTQFLGGSDAASIVGVSKWRSAVDVWLEKTGRQPPREVTSKAAEWGKRFEAPILDRAMEELLPDGAKAIRALPDEHPEQTLDRLVAAADEGVVAVVRNLRMLHPKHRYLAAEADAVIQWPTGERWIVDAKRTGMIDDWRDGDAWKAPIYYLPQFVLQMEVYNAHRHYAAVLGSGWGQEFFTAETRREPALATALLASLKDFWQDNVLAGKEPPVETYDEAAAVWPKHNPDDFIDPTEEDLERIRSYIEAKAAVKEAEAVRDQLKKEIAEALGTRQGFATIDPVSKKPRVYLDWKTQKASRVDLAKLRERHPEVAKECTVEGTSRVMRDKPKAFEVSQ